MNSLRHLNYLFWHKIYVFKRGLRWRVPIWQLIIHDLSKLTPSEFVPYTNHFFPTPKPRTAPTFPACEIAMELHFHRNPHHWQFWCGYSLDLGYCYPWDMPDNYRREMLADWDATGLSKTGKIDTKEWYLSRRDQIVLHPETRQWIEQQLGIAE